MKISSSSSSSRSSSSSSSSSIISTIIDQYTFFHKILHPVAKVLLRC